LWNEESRLGKIKRTLRTEDLSYNKPFRDIYLELEQLISSYILNLMKKYDENKIEIPYLEESFFPAIGNFMLNKLIPKKYIRWQRDSFTKRIKECAGKRIDSLIEAHKRLLNEVNNLSSKWSGYLSIYKCAESIRGIWDILELDRSQIGGDLIHIYFLRIIGEPKKIEITDELINLIGPIDKIFLKDDAIIRLVEKWDQEGFYEELAGLFCYINEFKGKGDFISRELRKIIPVLFPVKPDFETAKFILNLMLVNRGILELEIFRKAVSAR